MAPNNQSGSSRSRQRSRQQRVADELGIDPSQVAVRDTLDRGTEANLTSRGATAAERQARQQFASEAEFVQQEDVTAEADRQALSVSARIAENRRDDVEQRAESSVAEETDFVTPADLDADVGKRGVQGVGIAENRRSNVEQRAEQSFASESENITPADVDADVSERGVSDVSIPEERQDDVAERVRQQLLSDNEAAKPSDINVNVSESGIEEAGFREGAQRDIAARQIDQQISSVDVDSGDIRRGDDGFTPRDAVLKQAAAKQADPRTVADKEDLRSFLEANSSQDFVEITQGDTGPKLTRFPDGFDRSEAGEALELLSAVRDDETINASKFEGVEGDLNTPSASDYQVSVGDSGERSVSLTQPAQQQQAANVFDAQFSDVDLGVSDVEPTDGGGFGLDTGAQRQLAADRIADQTGFEQIDTGDVARVDNGFGLDSSTQREFAAQRIEEQTALESVDPNTGLTRGEGGFGLSTIGQRRLAAEQFEGQTELEEVDPQEDILLRDDGSAALADQTEKELAAELLDQQVSADVGVGDIDRVTDPDGGSQFVFEGVRR